MISIIICSRTHSIPQVLHDNIKSTVGSDYELVVIDNSDSNYDIFQAYNEGVRRAKGDILCFAHDDILFQSDLWGITLQQHFADNTDIGIIGVGGSHFLSSYPFYWSSNSFISEHCLHNDHGETITCFHEDYFPEGSPLSEVVVVDGLCMFMRASLFPSISFDTKSYRGFHAYDMDICMQVIAQNMKVAVCRDITVEHAWSEKTAFKKKSYQMLNENLLLFAQKWTDWLPITRGVNLPSHTTYKLNQIYSHAYDSFLVRHSHAYQIGHIILQPFHNLKDIFNKMKDVIIQIFRKIEDIGGGQFADFQFHALHALQLKS